MSTAFRYKWNNSQTIIYQNGNESHNNNVVIIFKRVWQSSRGTNPSFSALQDMSESSVRVRRDGLLSSRSDNTKLLFPPCSLYAHPSTCFIYRAPSPLSGLWPPVCFSSMWKIASYLLAFAALFFLALICRAYSATLDDQDVNIHKISRSDELQDQREFGNYIGILQALEGNTWRLK